MTLSDRIFVAIIRTIGRAAAAVHVVAGGLEAWQRELAAELVADVVARQPGARREAAAARCRPCPVPPPVPFLVNGRAVVRVAKA